MIKCEKKIVKKCSEDQKYWFCIYKYLRTFY